MSANDSAKPGARKRRRRSPTIREMVLDDLPGVFALGEQLYRADRFRALRWTWDEYELVGRFASDGEFCLIAELDGGLAGFVIGSLLEKRRSAWNYGYIEWLGVDEEFTRMGIAQALTDEVTERFREAGARMMIVDTDAENAGAIAFFEQVGFSHSVSHVYMSLNLEKE